MFDYKRIGLSTATGGLCLLVLAIISFALDFRAECVCDGFETCCETNVDACGEELCLCTDVLLRSESEVSYCSNKTVVPSLSLSFWVGYFAVVVGILLIKLGIVLCIAGACLERDRLRSQRNVAQGLPIERAPAKGDAEYNTLLS